MMSTSADIMRLGSRIVAEYEARMDWEPMMTMAPLAPSERSTSRAARMLW